MIDRPEPILKIDPGMRTMDTRGYRRVLRSLRIMDEHCTEVERVAAELGRRGLVDLADDLRLSVKSLRTLRPTTPKTA